MTTTPWAYAPAVKYRKISGLWTATARTPGTRAKRCLRATTYPEILTLYLSRNFDRESLLAAAETALSREEMQRRIRAVEYRNRKENQ